ncbi:MAG: lysophospholipid acyltransferase family protein [Betaproteobacteria bacterium]
MTSARKSNSRFVQCYRWTRTCVHALEGVSTTMLIFPLVSATTRRALIKRWSARLLRILAVEARFDGEMATQGGNVLVVANHISWLDIFVLNAVHPVRFVAKSELTQWPVISQMIRGAGTVFIERERRRDTHRVNEQMARVLAGGDVVAIFPEGTTTDGSDMLPFKSSLLQPIVEARGHVQPVAIRYCSHDGALSLAPAYVGDTSFASSFWSMCGARMTVVTLSARPPLAAHASHRRELARAAEISIRMVLASPANATAPETHDDPTSATQ